MSEQLELFGARIGEYVLPEDAIASRCQSCNAAIVWTRTKNGKAIPLSLKTVQERDGVKYALSHFADCEHAKQWSKKGRR